MNTKSRRLLGFLLTLTVMLGLLMPSTAISASNAQDQAKVDIATVLDNPAYLDATISTVEDFHYGDILQLTAAVFIFDGDQHHGQQTYLDNYTTQYKPFWDRLPLIMDFGNRIFYFDDLAVGEPTYYHQDSNSYQRMYGKGFFFDHLDWYFDQLKQLPDFATINVIFLADHTNGFEGGICDYEGKTYWLLNMSLHGATGYSIHGAIHSLIDSYVHTASSVMWNMANGHRPFPTTQADREEMYAVWRNPALPHYELWDAGSLHQLSRNLIFGLPPEIGMPTTRQSWSGGNPDHGWADFRIYTYAEATTQAELDVAIAGGYSRLTAEYAHHLLWAQTSPKSISLIIDPRDNQIGYDVALAKILSNRQISFDSSGQAVFHHLPIRDATPPPVTEQPSSWAADAVERADELGLLPDSFRSGFTQPTTRAEFTAIAVRLYERLAGPITGRQQFADTNDVNVEKAAYVGIVAGVGNNLFSPDSPLTREQAAVMLTRVANALNQPFSPSAPTFADNDQISAWAFDGVGAIQAAGIVTGVGNNTFAPQGPYTREQSVVTIMRLLEALSN